MVDQSAGFPLDAGRHYETRDGHKVLIRLAGAEAGTSGYVFAGDNGLLYTPTGRIARDAEHPQDIVALASVAETEDGQALHMHYPTGNAAVGQQDRIQANLVAEAQAKQPVAKTPADEAVLSQGGPAVIADETQSLAGRTVAVDSTVNTDREENPLLGIKTPDVDADSKTLAAQHESELMHPADGYQDLSSPETLSEADATTDGPTDAPAVETPVAKEATITPVTETTPISTLAPSAATSTETVEAHPLGGGVSTTPPTSGTGHFTTEGGGVSTTPPTTGSAVQGDLEEGGGVSTKPPGSDVVTPVTTTTTESVESPDEGWEYNKRILAEKGFNASHTSSSTDDKE